MSERTRDFIKNNAGYIAVAAVCAVYMATAFVTIGETGKTLGAIIAEGAVSFFLGTFITRLLDIQGLMLGEQDPKLIATHNEHSKIVVKISPNIDKLDEWCENMNAEALKISRVRILASAGMKYTEYFNETGEPKEFTFKKCKSLSERVKELLRYIAYKKALKPRLTPLSSSALTSEGGRVEDINYLGMTKSEYETRTGVRDILSKLALAGIFGYYGVDMLTNFSAATLIWRALQVGIFLIMGTIKLYRSYRFIIDDYRNRLIKKTDHLQKFDNYVASCQQDNREENKNEQ